MQQTIKTLKRLGYVSILGLAGCSIFEPLHDDGGTGTSDSSVGIDLCPGEIKINEVDGATTGSGADAEFIEIINTSTENINVGGLNIARTRGSGPDVGKARQIPNPHILAPSGLLYLVANVTDAEPGFQDDCIDAAPMRCLHVSWDINADGESIYLLNSNNTEILCEFSYPRTVAPGDAWGRNPDGSQTLGPVLPTPGAPNRAP